MNKNKLIVLVILVAAVAYPWWRLKTQSEKFVETFFDKAASMGTWRYGEVKLALSGVIHVSNVQLTPTGYTQGFRIRSVDMETNIWDLLLTSELGLIEALPSNLTITAKDIQFMGAGNDLQEMIVERDYWPVVVGYQGGFGCGDEFDRSFSYQQWQQIMPNYPVFDMEINYQNTGNFGLNFGVGIQARDLWYVNWSGTLELTDNSGKFIFQDTLVEQLYYTYQDAGFNAKRNKLCQKNHQDSFAAYRLHSAERLQQQLRVLVSQEMTEEVSNWYQRSLFPDSEINAIFNFKNKEYLQRVFDGEQTDFLGQVDIEVALDESNYTPLDLRKINYLAMDPELLKDQYEQKKKREEERLAALNQPKELIKTVKTTIGKQNRTTYINIKNWDDAVGSKVVVRTRRGRPIFGRLKAVKGDEIIMTSQYVSGKAEISIQRGNILSLNLLN
ncbi:hypothetical protein [Marinicella sp. W31]|uniref:hypothetical protein n=1 Tax=Marinicella sp. W31 TaxID=3023713 RepID=UPI0037565C6E